MQLIGSRLRGAQRGVGLIEVLIAVLVLSFGMLGLVGLQTWSLRNNQSALERGMATVQTHSIADVMRADRDNAISGAYDIDLDDPAPSGTSFRDLSIAAWRAALQQGINATATGSIDCGSDAICTIVVEWNDRRAEGTTSGPPLAFTTEVEL